MFQSLKFMNSSEHKLPLLTVLGAGVSKELKVQGWGVSQRQARQALESQTKTAVLKVDEKPPGVKRGRPPTRAPSEMPKATLMSSRRKQGVTKPQRTEQERTVSFLVFVSFGSWFSVLTM